MKLNDRDMAAAHKLLSEHLAHEDVRGYDPEVYSPTVKGTMLTRAFILGALMAGLLYWLGGLLGALVYG